MCAGTLPTQMFANMGSLRCVVGEGWEGEGGMGGGGIPSGVFVGK